MVSHSSNPEELLSPTEKLTGQTHLTFSPISEWRTFLLHQLQGGKICLLSGNGEEQHSSPVTQHVRTDTSWSGQGLEREGPPHSQHQFFHLLKPGLAVRGNVTLAFNLRATYTRIIASPADTQSKADGLNTCSELLLGGWKAINIYLLFPENTLTEAGRFTPSSSQI